MPQPNAPLPPSRPFLLDPFIPHEAAEKEEFKAFSKPFLLTPFTSDDAELAYASGTHVSATQVSGTHVAETPGEAKVSEDLLQKLALEQQEQGILSRVG